MNKNINIVDAMQQGRLNKHRVEMGLETFCPACGKPLTNKNAQYAHYISQGKQARAKYGDEIVNHTFNGAYVCSLRCNNDIQIDRQPEYITYLKNDINEDILSKEMNY